MSKEPLRAPFPWFGGKSRAAGLIWSRLGNVPHYIEPFAGSLAVLLGRPHDAKVETVNDKDGLIANVWRAIAACPDEVARWADWPVNEADLHARHRWLVDQALPLTERLVADPDYCDAKVAGWWIWGICAWIGNGWCSKNERLHRCIPKIATPGHGINAMERKRPHLGRSALRGDQERKRPMISGDNAGKGVHRLDLDFVFAELADRLRKVRVCCGDWTRVLGNSTLGIGDGPGHSHGLSPCGVVLDPPYASWRADPMAKRIADGHYSRQNPASAQFVPPGRCVVLVIPTIAYWVTAWPFAKYVNRTPASASANTSSEIVWSRRW
jgi:DNA adenine methylase